MENPHPLWNNFELFFPTNMRKAILKLFTEKHNLYSRTKNFPRNSIFWKAFDYIELYEYPCDETSRITDDYRNGLKLWISNVKICIDK